MKADVLVFDASSILCSETMYDVLRLILECFSMYCRLGVDDIDLYKAYCSPYGSSDEARPILRIIYDAIVKRYGLEKLYVPDRRFIDTKSREITNRTGLHECDERYLAVALAVSTRGLKTILITQDSDFSNESVVEYAKNYNIKIIMDRNTIKSLRINN